MFGKTLLVEQPKTWAELLNRAKDIKAKTGAYGLLFPAGVTLAHRSVSDDARRYGSS